MADPIIQTFCCHHSNGTDMVANILKEFNTDAYNSVCMFSSALGIMGAIYQLLPRVEYTGYHNWMNVSRSRTRTLALCLAVADLLASASIFVRSSLWLNNKSVMPYSSDEGSILFCRISSIIIQYCYMTTWMWTLCYCIDMRLVLNERNPRMIYYHLMSWIMPAILTAIGLGIMYIPHQGYDGHTIDEAFYRLLPNYLATYLPMVLIMLVNPCLLYLSQKDVRSIIISSTGMYTRRERDFLSALKLKHSTIMIVFYICWLPNVINGIIMWVLWFNIPVHHIVGLWYVMALLNPLQAVFDCLTYRKWRMSICEPYIVPAIRPMTATDNKSDRRSLYENYTYESFGHPPSADEVYPLLHDQIPRGLFYKT